MSTRSRIIVPIIKEYKNKRLIDSISYNSIILSDDYVMVTCHFDGYIEGIGKILKENIKTYEEAIDIVSHGDLSSLDVDENGNLIVDAYISDKNENWKYVKPKQTNNIEKPSIDLWLDTEYLYLYIPNPDKNIESNWKVAKRTSIDWNKPNIPEYRYF